MRIPKKRSIHPVRGYPERVVPPQVRAGRVLRRDVPANLDFPAHLCRGSVRRR